MTKLRSRTGKLPLPLLFALAVAVGAVVKFLVQINVVVPASWDPRYATSNGTHIYQTGPMIIANYKTLVLGYGTAYFQNPVSVYYLDRVYKHSSIPDTDLGKYLPVMLIVEFGSLPTNTYVAWTDPHSNTTRKLYLVSGTNRGYVIGLYTHYTSSSVAIIPVYYWLEGPTVRIYPMERSAVDVDEACSVGHNSGFTGTYYSVFTILDVACFDCRNRLWYENQPIEWTRVASLVTTARLYPFPTHYTVTVNVGGNRVTLVLSYWYAVDNDPDFFVVKLG